MKRALRWLGILLLVAALGAGGYWVYTTKLSPSATLAAAASDDLSQVVSVLRGDLKATISVVGELYAVQQDDLSFDRLSGTTQLLSLEAVAGGEVVEGQVLATVDTSFYEQALDQAESDLQEAEERLLDLQTPASELEIARADLAITRAELNVMEAEQDLEDLLDEDFEDLEQDLADALLDLAEAQADLADLENDEAVEDKLYDLREKEVEISAEYTRLANESYTDSYHQDRLRVAYNDLLDAKDTIARTEVQAEKSLQNARSRVRKAEDKVSRTEEALADALEGVDELDLAEAEMAIAEAKVELASAEERRAALDEGPDAVDLASAQADLDKKQLAVTEAQEDLQAATVIAPFTGTILDCYAEQGDLVNKNSTILTVANLDELEVLAAVDETTIRQIEAGQSATITFDAFPGHALVGEVLSIPLQGELQGGVTVYQVPVSLRGTGDLDLRVGMTANVEIAVGEARDVLLVPTMGLLNVGGLQQVLVPVYTDDGMTTDSVPVEVGLSNGVYTEIVRGLIEGDEIIVQLESDDGGMFNMRALGQMMGGGGAGPGAGGGQRLRQ